MKRIWNIVGRVGTILFTIGYAFVLLSIFAQSAHYQQFSYGQTINSQQFQPLGTNYVIYNSSLQIYEAHPLQYNQESMSMLNLYNITIKSNATLNMYIIDMNIYEFVNPTSYPLPYQIQSEQLNLANLDNILQNKPILWQGTVTNGSTFYTPTRDGNITIFLSNTSNETAQIEFTVDYYRLYAPRLLSMEIGAATIPVGLILSAPLLKSMAVNNYRRTRNRLRRK